MNNFEFYNPVKVVFGAGEVAKTGTEVRALGSKALLVSYSDNGFMKELLDRVIADMEVEGVTVVPFFQVVANPLLSTVELGVELCKEQGIDVIVAVGGGSVIDTAKFVAAGVHYEGEIWDMVSSRTDEDTSVPPTSALPTVMVSTIPATGSEMNSGAVISNEKLQEKAHIFAECVFPKVAILDPELTCTLPPFQTGCGIADAISHVLEVYLNGTEGDPLQTRIMDGVVQTLIEAAPKVLEDPNDIKARGNIQWAACVAWNGWTHTGVEFTAPMHMIGHPISALHNVTHGATLSIVMPAFMKYTYKTCPELYAQFGQNMLGLDGHGKDVFEIAAEAVETFEAFLKTLNIPIRLSDCDIKEEDIETIVDNCVRVGFTAEEVLPARTPLTKDDVRNILKLAL